MSLWSISAAKKKDEEVPGTSKWIRKELHTLHELMINNTEQFAYSVASELAWIDEQMEDIFSTTEENPRLLLESPKKLRGENSPVKKLRQQAVLLKSPQRSPMRSPAKSPMKELDINALKLSPIKFQKPEAPSVSADIKKKVASNVEAPLREVKTQKTYKDNSAEPTKSYNPFLEAPQPLPARSTIISPIKTQPKATKPAPRIYSPDELVLSTKNTEHVMLSPNHSDEEHGDYDASVDENSFHEIRAKIRKSLIKGTTSEGANTTGDSSYKSADEGSRPSSLVAQPSSNAAGSSLVSLPSQTDSVETIKVPLKEENKKKKSFVSNTPPPAKRESQGFALLPQRDPLKLKSAKKKENSKPRLSLFDDDFNISTSKEEKLTPPTFTKSLYPTISLESTNPSSAASLISPIPKSTIKKLGKNNQSPTKLKEPASIPLKSKLASPKRPDLTASTSTGATKSPTKLNYPTAQSPKKVVNSPISNLFASVNSTLKKARSKFVRETEKVISDAVEKEIPVHYSELSPSKSGPLNQQGHSHTLVMSHSENVIPTHTNDDAMEEDEDDGDGEDDDEDLSLKRDSLKFSPVKSAYGYLRKEMNESPKKKETNDTVAKDMNFKAQSDMKKQSQPRNLTRVSLSKPDENLYPRKSRGGLASMSLEAKAKSSRPKSLVGEQPSVPSKRKSQTEEESHSINRAATNQPYRKIGTKIVAPSVSQTKQAQQDAKRRRTAEQLQNVLQKRASRVSYTNQLSQQAPSEPEPPRVIKPTPKYAVPNNQTLMKTAVLQHAAQSKMNNPFQNGSSTFQSTYSKSNMPMTPTTTTALPEIFSESDDDEEGSVLKDWANSPELRNILINQQHMDPDKVFGPIAPLQMEEIFQNSNVAKLKNRGSSAQWTRDGLTTQEVENYKSRTYKR